MTIFKKTQLNDQYGFIAECTPLDELRVATCVRLVGAVFVGSVIDPNFWTTTIAASGGTIATAVQAGTTLTISSETDATGSVIVQTVRRARFVGAASNRFRGNILFGDTGVTDNTKRWGAFDGTNGAYFKLSGTTLSVCTMKAGSETAVASGSWNGSTTTPTLTNNNTYEIYITNVKAYFVIGGVLVHTVSAATSTWSDTLNLPCRADNINSGSTTNSTMAIRAMTTYRLGELTTQPTYAHITTAGTYVLKYGAGTLHRIVLNNAGGTLITVYDNTAGSGTIIAIINTPAGANPVSLEYVIPFSNGLTFVTTGTWDLTIIYE